MRTIEITGNIGCINNCFYCPQQILVNSYKQESIKLNMTLSDFKFYLSKIPKNIQIDFSGMSEIFQNNESIEMILHAYEKNYNMIFYTTLVGLTLEKINKISHILKEKQVVVHLPDKMNYAKIKITDEYKNVLKRIIEIKDGNIIYNSYCEVSDELSQFNLKSILLQKNLLLSRASNLKNVEKPEIKNGTLKCKVNREHNVLLPNGIVLLCCMDYSMKNKLGNLKYKSFEEIINSKQNYDICKNCELSEEI